MINQILLWGVIVSSISLLSCVKKQKDLLQNDELILVEHAYGYRVKHDTVFLKLADLKKQLGDVDFTRIKVIDKNNEQPINAFLVNDPDSKAAYFALDVNLHYREPLRHYMLSKSDSVLETVSFEVERDTVFSWKCLTNYSDFAEGKPVGKISDKIVNTFMDIYPNSADLEVFYKHRWYYATGYYLNAVYELGEVSNKQSYKDYTKAYIEYFTDDNGLFSEDDLEPHKKELDVILPGRLLLYLFEDTKDSIYTAGADQLIKQLEEQPRTKTGGFWHKQQYEWQMWLDGIYMADLYMMQYGHAMNKPELIEDGINQILLLHDKVCDSVSGLYYHGWDEAKAQIWADSVSGHSPEFWARGLGWYHMTLIDALEYIPEDHPKRDTLIKIFKDLSKSLLAVQDSESHLWYQVLDKGDRQDNWIETSASAMFAYAFAKGAKQGVLPDEYLVNAQSAFESLKKDYLYFDDEEHLYMLGTVKVGTLNTKKSDGSYEYYINVDRRINDFKGVASLLYLAKELEY